MGWESGKSKFLAHPFAANVEEKEGEKEGLAIA